MSLGFQNLPILKTVLAFIVGIILSDQFPQDSIVIKYLLFPLFNTSLFLVMFLKKEPFLKSLIILLSLTICGVMHHSMCTLEFSNSHFSKDEKASFLIYQIEESNKTKNGYKLTTSVKFTGSHIDTIRPSTGNLVVYQKNGIAPKVGDQFITTSRFLIEKKNKNPHVFDYKSFLENKNIYHRMYADSLSTLQLGYNENSYKAIFSNLRKDCLKTFETHLKDLNQLSIASAMILGQRDLITDDLYSAFTDTGAVHVLAVSGLHVGIVSGFVLLLFKILKKRTKTIIIIECTVSIICVWVFALLTGAAPAVIRAALMFSLLLIGRSINRFAHTFNILGLAALSILLFNPKYLFQVGFQFSFLALTGIIYFFPYLRSLISTKSKLLNYIWDLSGVAISAQLLVAPLAVFYFHKLPIYFILSGIIAIPAALAILLLGISLLFFDCVFSSEFFLTICTGKIFGDVISIFNILILKIQSLPYCSANDLWISATSVVLIYSAILWLGLFLKAKKPKYLIVTVLFLGIQMCTHLYEDYKIMSEKKMIVYDIYKASLIQFINNGYIAEIGSLNTISPTKSYLTTNSNLYHRKTKFISTKEMGLQTKEYFNMVGDLFFIYEPLESILNYNWSKPLDLLILNSNSYLDIEKIKSLGPIKEIVVDGSIGKQKSKMLRKSASKYSIPIHFTSQQGAYERIW